MEIILLWLFLTIAIGGVGLALWLSRRLLRSELPESLVLVAYFETEDELEVQLAALADRLTWTDRDLVQAVWLVDGTPDASLARICETFCNIHSAFHYFPLAELAPNLRNLQKF